MKPTIHLALTHDWELRGDGSGDIEQIQFAPMRALLELYRKHGARTTFLPDVMQQLAFRRRERQHSELKLHADRWDQHAREAFQSGHDLQLHLHPQWLNSQYENGKWQLTGDWSILNYNSDAAYAMLAESKSYLEELLRPIDSTYRCLAFRAGALAAAPSDHLFESLASLGIRLDVSIAGGLLVDNDKLKLDYRNCAEAFLPFYPKMQDARRVSDKLEEIVCVPLSHFYGSRVTVSRQNILLAQKELGRRLRSKRSSAQDLSSKESPSTLSNQSSLLGQVYEKVVLPAVRRKHFVADTGRLNYALLREMLTSIRQRARASGLAQLPIVLTNHPKDIRDFAAIERFVGEASQAEDIKFITLSEVTEKLRNGEFQVRCDAP